MLVTGPHVEESREVLIEIRNPATGELINSVPRARAIEVERAIQIRVEGRAAMREMPAYRRSEILRKASEVIGDGMRNSANCYA